MNTGDPSNSTGTGYRSSASYRLGREAQGLRRVRGEPDAVEVARPVRRAGRRNPPGESRAGRSGPTPTPTSELVRAGCISPACSISARDVGSATRWLITCAPNSSRTR